MIENLSNPPNLLPHVRANHIDIEPILDGACIRIGYKITIHSGKGRHGGILNGSIVDLYRTLKPEERQAIHDHVNAHKDGDHARILASNRRLPLEARHHTSKKK